LAAVATVGVMGAGVLAGRAGAGSPGGVRPRHERVYLVRSGDTVWGIASRLVGAGGDPRPVVDEVIRINGLKDAAVWPGLQLRLPG
jgi:LysM domain-containing protein